MASKSLVTLSAITFAFACAGVAEANPFSNGQFVTYDQGDWAVGGVATSLLTADYGSVYAPSNGVLIMGSVSPGQFAMAFTNAGAVLSYMPASGIPGPLTRSVLNPTTTASGIFGGDVVALTLNVDFSNAGFLQGTSDIPFRNLILANFSGSLSGLNGLTVNQFLAIADICLGDGSCPYGLDNLAGIADELDASFDEGSVSTFADDYLALPASAVGVPEPRTLGLLSLNLGALVWLRWRRIGSQRPSARPYLVPGSNSRA